MLWRHTRWGGGHSTWGRGRHRCSALCTQLSVIALHAQPRLYLEPVLQDREAKRAQLKAEDAAAYIGADGGGGEGAGGQFLSSAETEERVVPQVGAWPHIHLTSQPGGQTREPAQPIRSSQPVRCQN